MARIARSRSLDTCSWQTRDELAPAIIIWVERTYNRRRRQQALGKMNLAEFEAVHYRLAVVPQRLVARPRRRGLPPAHLTFIRNDHAGAARGSSVGWIARDAEHRKELEAHPFNAMRRRWQALARTYDLHDRNAWELLDLLENFTSDSDLANRIVKGGQTEESREFFSDLNRFLHNWLASATTLIDHSRRVMREYQGRDFGDEYQARVDALIADPRAQVVTKLRNYVMHRAAPPLVGSVKWGLGEGFSNHVSLSVPILLEWDGWTATGREWLESLGKSYELDTEVQHYQKKVSDLNVWLHERHAEVEADVLEDYKALLQQGIEVEEDVE